MSFFTRKFTGKTRSRSMTESQIKAITKDQQATGNASNSSHRAATKGKDELDREYASLRNTGRSKSNFRPVQHSTVAEIDSFFGATSSGKSVQHSVNHSVKDQNTGQIWYDTIEQQEWRKLLPPSNSPGTPSSRRSSSTSFLVSTPAGGTSANWPNSSAAAFRRRSVQSPLRSANDFDSAGPLSPLSELIDCFDNSPFVGANMTASPKTPGLYSFSQRYPGGDENRAVLPIIQSTLAGGLASPPSDDLSPVTLDLASTSPFFADQKNVNRSKAHHAAASGANPRSGRAFRAALGLLSPTSPTGTGFSAREQGVKQETLAGSRSRTSQEGSSSRRLSFITMSTSPLNKFKVRASKTEESNTREEPAPNGTAHQNALLQPALASPALLNAEDQLDSGNDCADPAKYHANHAHLAQNIDVLMMQSKTPLIQRPPSKAELSLRPRRAKKTRRIAGGDSLAASTAGRLTLLRRTSSTGDLGAGYASYPQSGGEQRRACVPNDDAPEARDFIRRATLALQRLQERERAHSDGHAHGNDDEDACTVSRPPSAASCAPSLAAGASVFSHASTTAAAVTTTGLDTNAIALPPLPLFQRRFVRLDRDKDAAPRKEAASDVFGPRLGPDAVHVPQHSSFDPASEYFG